jgi:hypothetical protein
VAEPATDGLPYLRDPLAGWGCEGNLNTGQIVASLNIIYRPTSSWAPWRRAEAGAAREITAPMTPGAAVSQSCQSHPRRRLSIELVVVMVIFVLVPLAFMDLPANLARRQRCRMNVGIGRIRGERVRKRVEVTGHHILARDR